ncbi:MAG: anaerobic ribonucleoside-triphosphate reductase activating protein [Chromatiaceae bacterium]|nr:anaerobic ribonucleoside-triphosphate reductase activating protein [Chromatiaceae bacterium]
MDKEALRIGGLTSLTSLDYPGELAAVIFCQGCPWRCAYCHNQHLLPSDSASTIPWGQIEAFLERRQGLLDAVVFSGGEPTLQHALPAALGQVKGMGFKIGLHTAGIYPERLWVLGPLLDWVGLDIKALPEDYPAVTGAAGAGERAWRSLRLLVATGVSLEVRTTLPPDWRLARGMETLMRRLADAGVQDYALQTHRATHPRHEDPRTPGFPTPPPPETYAKLGEALFRRFVLR